MVIFLLLYLHHVDFPCREIGVVVSASSRVIVWTHLKLQSRRIARVTRHALANYDVIFPSRRGRRLPIAPGTSEGSPWKIHRGRSRRGTDILRVKYHPEHIIRTLEKRPVRVLDIGHVPQYAANLYVNHAVYLLFLFLFFSSIFSPSRFSPLFCSFFWFFFWFLVFGFFWFFFFLREPSSHRRLARIFYRRHSRWHELRFTYNLNVAKEEWRSRSSRRARCRGEIIRLWNENASITSDW